MSVPDGFEVSGAGSGPRAVLHGPWRPEFLDHLQPLLLEAIELNQGKGWRGSDVSFLSAFPRLRTLELVDLTIRDIEGIHTLHDLRTLVLLTYSTTNVRFDEFPHLESCDLSWGKRHAETLFGCTTLEHLGLDHFPRRDLGDLARLVRLRSLWVTTSPLETLAGIEALRGLRELHLRGLRKLATLRGIEGLADLEDLELHTCRRVRSIEPVARLAKLRKLHLNNGGGIASLKPLEGLAALEEVVFYESTNVLDGDLSPLERLPRLRLLAFQNRRHYSHRCEQFLAFREARHD